MKKNTLLILLCSFVMFAAAQAPVGRTVLIEEFVETGCSACAQYDSAFQALTKANAGKIAVISYHCHYNQDPFYVFNNSCDSRYEGYQLSGFPCAMMNGRKPVPTSAHLSYVNTARINALYNQPALFNIDVKCKPAEGSGHSVKIKVGVTALEDNPSENLRLHVVITENNIDYEKRYGKKSVNGINEFNHIMRAMLPDSEGTPIAPQKKGIKTVTAVDYTNDDKEINFEEVRIVVFVQDIVTKEVLAATVTQEHPFK